jgi:hypothetical protein
MIPTFLVDYLAEDEEKYICATLAALLASFLPLATRAHLLVICQTHPLPLLTISDLHRIISVLLFLEFNFVHVIE